MFSNKLTDVETERLAVLLEELGEAQQAIGKILRHGYESYDPARENDMNIEGQNRRDLAKELGDVVYAINMLTSANDISGAAVGKRCAEKVERIKPYLHHQKGRND